MRRILCLLCACIFGTVAAQAFPVNNMQHLSVSAEAQAPDASNEIWVALHFQPEEGWHLSKELPNQMGPGIKLQSNDPHITFSPLIWPKGTADQIDGSVTVLTHMHTTTEFPKNLNLTVQWVVCNTQCVPGSQTLSLSLEALTPNHPQITQALQAASTTFNPIAAGGELSSSLLWIALGAFAGGMLLNLMPCVLPVLSLKVISMVESAKESAKKRWQLAGSYLAGVMLSFWTLSALLLALQASGREVGWGFQLQEPWFVGALAGLFFLLSLNLFGLFEWGSSLTQLDGKTAHKKGLSASFWSGILATIVATPCTGPLLGASLGLAMTLSWFHSLLLFSAIGFGMALPFCLLVAIPAFTRFLPKPGHWMITLKQLMGFAMLAAVLWLLWVWQAQTASASVIWLLAGFLFLGLAAWIFGRWGQISCRKGVRLIGKSASLMMLFLFVLSLSEGAMLRAAPQNSIEHVQEETWEPFSMKKIEDLRASHTPVFIDFTAKWCLICQFNKAILHSSGAEKIFEDKKIVLLSADWTKGDPEITRALKHFGRSGVPLYIYIDAQGQQTILPETLSLDLLKNTIDGV